MKPILLLIFISFAHVCLACTCAPIGEFKTKDDLQNYSFIALVTIKQLPAADNTGFRGQRVKPDIGVELIEQFKGTPEATVYDASYNSDCTLTLNAGEQWIFFGYENNGRTEVSRCSFSVRYRDTLGAREWRNFTGIKQLDVLRTIYQQHQPGKIGNKLFYISGKPEIEQSFNKGKLNGWRKIYYPDGAIYMKEKFKDGIRVDTKSVYHKNGQLMETIVYNNGLKTMETRYQDTTENAWYLNFKATHLTDLLFGDKEHDAGYYYSLLDSLRKLKDWDKQIAYQRRFSDNGFSYAYEMYNYKGGLQVKNYLDWNKKVSEHTLYYDTGKPEMYLREDQGKNEEVEYDYKPDGTRKDFMKKCESCRFYFDDANPAGKQESVYIQ